MATEPPKRKGRPGYVPDDHICARCLLCDGIGKFASTMRHISTIVLPLPTVMFLLLCSLICAFALLVPWTFIDFCKRWV